MQPERNAGGNQEEARAGIKELKLLDEEIGKRL